MGTVEPVTNIHKHWSY